MEIFQSHNTPRKRVQIKFPKKGKTKQSFKNECDINLIIERHTKTGQAAPLNRHKPNYGYATSQDFGEAMRTVTDAQTSFNNLSEEIRSRFNDNPGQFLDFVQNPGNKDEGAELGLWPKDPTTILLDDEPPVTPENMDPPKETDTQPKKD